MTNNTMPPFDARAMIDAKMIIMMQRQSESGIAIPVISNCPDCDRPVGNCPAIMIGRALIIACEGYHPFDANGIIKIDCPYPIIDSI